MPTWAEPYLTGDNPFFYPFVFLALMGCGLGAPMNSDLILLTCSYLIYKDKVSYAIMVPLAITAILTGDTLMFFFARKYGVGLTRVWPFKKVLTEERIAKARGAYQKNGYRMVFTARFMPGIRTVFMFVSGLMHLKYPKFIAHNFAGAAIVIPSALYAVTWVGGNQEAVLAILKKSQWFVIAALVVFIVSRFFPKASSRTE